MDASNAGFFVLLALSRFRQASFLESGFEIDRFVIIFYSVMICRLAFEAIIRVFRGVCRPEGRMVDALADSTDEGRLRLRYASGSRQQGFDPRISEWGNPPAVMGRHRVRAGGTQGSETSQYLQERMFRE